MVWEDREIKVLSFIFAVIALPAFAQSNTDPLVRFTGFLGDLRFGVDDVRAQLVGEDDDEKQVAVAMNEDAAAAFTLFTTTHVNQSVTMYVCGEEVETLRFDSPDDSGFALSGLLDADIAEEMVLALNGLGDCPR